MNHTTMKLNFNSSRQQILISFSKKICSYNKSFVFDTHFFVFVIRIKLFLMSLLTMAFKKSFLYQTYSLWTFSKILFFTYREQKNVAVFVGPWQYHRIYAESFCDFLRVENSWWSDFFKSWEQLTPTTQRLSVIRVEKNWKSVQY